MLLILCLITIIVILVIGYIVANTPDKLEREIHERFMILITQINNDMEELKQLKKQERELK